MSLRIRITEQARARFAEQIEKLDLRSDWGKLPPLDIAMHPAQVSFSDDLSDGRYYNERFIESRIIEGNTSAGACFLGMMHNMLFISLVAGCIEYKAIVWPVLIFYLLFGVLFCLNVIRVLVDTVSFGFVRFNRQAQLVHFWGGGKRGQLIHVPWREVVPFTSLVGVSLTGGNLLRLLFPTPEGVVDRGRELEVSGALSFGDGSFTSNLSRLEFLRRYMAHGLEAVQPGRQAIEAGVVSPPSGYTDQPMPTGLSAFSKFTWQFWRYLLDKPMYYAGGGPLIDRWIKRAADSYRWPEEVERLCAEGADLSGIDTTPVAAHANLFYRYGGMHNPIQYVDAQGRELR